MWAIKGLPTIVVFEDYASIEGFCVLNDNFSRTPNKGMHVSSAWRLDFPKVWTCLSEAGDRRQAYGIVIAISHAITPKKGQH